MKPILPSLMVSCSLIIFLAILQLSFIPENELLNIIQLQRDFGIGKMAANPTSLVLHSSGTSSMEKAVQMMLLYNYGCHFIIDTDGTIYQSVQNLDDRVHGTSLHYDTFSIQILVIGMDEKALLSNAKQKKNLIGLIKKLSDDFTISLSNKAFTSNQGIFSHSQLKQKYGKFTVLDRLDPGENFMKEVLIGAGGEYIPEKEWEERENNTKWKLRKSWSTFSGNKKRTYSNGRGITPTPASKLSSIESDNTGKIIESRRLKYNYVGDNAGSCIVLHYTMSKNYAGAQGTLEERGLSASIIVDRDGKAYQMLDDLSHTAEAAANTNKYCFQIEIVGVSEKDLLGNKPQRKAVAALVNEICEKYQIPKDNYDIAAYKGVFSHGQQKKMWGNSFDLVRKEFDPGEDYMKYILETIGGTYYYELPTSEETSWIIVSELLSLLFRDHSTYEPLFSIAPFKPQRITKSMLWKDRYSGKWTFVPTSWMP